MQQNHHQCRLSRAKHVLAYSLGSVIATFSVSVHAANCQGDKTLITLPSITIASDAPIGTVLWSKKSISFSSYCPISFFGDTGNIYLWRADLHSALNSYGLTFWLKFHGQGGNSSMQIKNVKVLDIPWGGSGGSANGEVDLELRKIGKTPEGGKVSSVADIVAFYLDSNTNNNKGSHFIRGLSNISFISYTCSVDTNSQNMTVPLGKVRTDRFTGVGSTFAEQNFNIHLSCTQPAGIYNVAVTFSAVADDSRTPGVLALESGPNTATGVGIQLLKDGSPVEFEHALPVGSATKSTMFTIPMTARYYQTGHTVIPGEAKGIATFVLTYK